MRRQIENLLKKNSFIFHLSRKAFWLVSNFPRVTLLCPYQIPEERVQEILRNKEYNNVLEDLTAYTGFTLDELKPYILRHPKKHFESEFNWFDPKTRKEVTWFYRCSSGYLFGNAIHPYQTVLDRLTSGTVLDYGAGAGCNTIGLAKRGLSIDFLEISRMQADFINFRARRQKLPNVREILPFHEGKFDPVFCITNHYDAIVAMDVLEHIPDYPVVIDHFIGRLKPGGILIEKSPFDPNGSDTSIHVPSTIPLEEIMAGRMDKVDAGVWKKRA